MTIHPSSPDDDRSSRSARDGCFLSIGPETAPQRSTGRFFTANGPLPTAPSRTGATHHPLDRQLGRRDGPLPTSAFFVDGATNTHTHARPTRTRRETTVARSLADLDHSGGYCVVVKGGQPDATRHY